MTERRISVPGGTLAVHDFGEGPAIVLLHATIVNAWAWEPLTPFLLQAGYRVVAFDARGAGDTITQDVEYSPRADTLAVLEGLSIELAALVGNSVGGQVAVDTAIEHPDRVVAIVTVGANLGGWFPEMPAHERAIDDELMRIEGSGDPAAIADAEVRAWVDGPGQPPDRVPDEIRELVREMVRESAASGRDRGQPLPMQPAAAQQLERLGMPVLAIAGGLDFSFASDAARYMAANAPRARAMVMPDVAHMIGLEAPQELSQAIVEFLAPLPRWG